MQKYLHIKWKSDRFHPYTTQFSQIFQYVHKHLIMQISYDNLQILHKCDFARKNKPSETDFFGGMVSCAHFSVNEGSFHIHFKIFRAISSVFSKNVTPGMRIFIWNHGHNSHYVLFFLVLPAPDIFQQMVTQSMRQADLYTTSPSSSSCRACSFPLSSRYSRVVSIDECPRMSASFEISLYLS